MWSLLRTSLVSQKNEEVYEKGHVKTVQVRGKRVISRVE